MQEPHISFYQARLKVEWAKKQIADFNEVSKQWIDAKPYDITFKMHPQSGDYEFNVGLRDALPAWIPLIMGDICGNLRASLDYVWMGLVRAANRGEVPSKATLPFANNRKGLISTISKAPIGSAAKEAERLLTTVVNTHEDFLDGGSKGLVALNKSANWNKHNLLIASLGVTSLRNVKVGGITIGQLRVKGGKANVVTFANQIEAPKLDYDDNATVEIVFGQHNIIENEPVIPTLVQFAQLCTEAVHAFDRAFPEGG